jgi:hypothetical protein
MKFTMKTLTPAAAETQFPGCLTEDLLQSLEVNKVEPGYCTLGTYEGRLFACNYEIAFLSWGIFTDGEWNDLENVDYDLSEQFDVASFEWV